MSNIESWNIIKYYKEGKNINKKYITAITGASGSIYAKRLIDGLTAAGAEIFLLFSDTGLAIFEHELNVKLPGKEKLAGFFRDYFKNRGLVYLENTDFHASISSGSFRTDGMVVVPASMGCIGRIASGVSTSLIKRAADVVLKERRKLILVPRETPLNSIHLENMLRISRAGGIILPAMPAFYQKPGSIDDLVDFVAGRVLDSLDITGHGLYKRWE